MTPPKETIVEGLKLVQEALEHYARADNEAVRFLKGFAARPDDRAADSPANQALALMTGALPDEAGGQLLRHVRQLIMSVIRLPKGLTPAEAGSIASEVMMVIAPYLRTAALGDRLADAGKTMPDTLSLIAGLLEPVKDYPWTGKWRVLKVLEICLPSTLDNTACLSERVENEKQEIAEQPDDTAERLFDELTDALGAELGKQGFIGVFTHNAQKLARVAVEIMHGHIKRESGWQPIETAPKDGEILLIGRADGWVMRAWWREDKGGHWFVSPGFWTEQEPTHWMPLPQPPAQRSRSREEKV